MPVDRADELTRIIIADRHLGLNLLSSLVFDGSHVEGEEVAGQKPLLHHRVNEWHGSFFGKARILHSDDGSVIALE